MYAVIETGGKQYRVEQGRRLRVETLAVEPGSEVTFDKVLFLSGEEISVGQPYVKTAKVVGKVLSHGRAKKIIVFKFKRRKGYRRKQGHRQNYTEVQIVKINP